MAAVSSPVTLLRLVPWALPQRLLQGLPCPYDNLTGGNPPPPPPTPKARTQALSTVLPYLMSHRSRLLAADDASQEIPSSRCAPTPHRPVGFFGGVPPS